MRNTRESRFKHILKINIYQLLSININYDGLNPTVCPKHISIMNENRFETECTVSHMQRNCDEY